ncbi:hypothetical protein MRX96_003582 [Rhipicephalus microplus]
MDAVTIPSTSSTHYLDFMTSRWIPRFGVPSVIITDQVQEIRIVTVATAHFDSCTATTQKLPGELNFASVEGDIDESHRLHDLARGRAETRERLLQSQRKTTVRYDKKRRTPRFITGDLVLLELSARGTLDPRYEGPFEITALVGGNRAEIQKYPTHRA